MPDIKLLDQSTIDLIAAGEVVERPSSVVKELVENAIDAGSGAVTIEIRQGGISMIRITDNGCGIPKEQVREAFCRHTTSKIRSAKDLESIASLGFRGEALSSIAAVSRVEIITKPPGQLTGVRYRIESGTETGFEEAGAPDGTTIIVRDLFYHTPARKKFLRTPQTEAGYISELTQKLALSHPEISFQLIIDGKIRLYTSGNGSVKDHIYHIYGREITANLLPLEYEGALFQIRGYIGKPLIGRGNRNYETFFVNGRYIRSKLLSKALEDGYQGFLMQHRFPFAVLFLEIGHDLVDVNVHPAKMEVRFTGPQTIYDALTSLVRTALSDKELISSVPLEKETKKTEPVSAAEPAAITEPFEKKQKERIRKQLEKTSPYHTVYENSRVKEGPPAEQISLLDDPAFLSQEASAGHQIIGQLFDTYWLLSYQEQLYIVDQHAAHEKVLYERMLASRKKTENPVQMIAPPVILSLSMSEEKRFLDYLPYFNRMGFEIEPFGSGAAVVRGIPSDLAAADAKPMLMDLLDEIGEINSGETSEMITQRIARSACKAAVKGNQKISKTEAKHLIDELMTLENPYFCPHGRPVIISISKRELEKKFKRVVS